MEITRRILLPAIWQLALAKTAEVGVRADGFVACLVRLPSRNALCRFWHELSGEVWTGYVRDVTDVTYVWAKLSGIEREAR